MNGDCLLYGHWWVQATVEWSNETSATGRVPWGEAYCLRCGEIKSRKQEE